MHCCCQARGQDEDEMAPPQKIPQSCLSLCWSGWRGHTPWSGEHETSPPAPPNMAVLVVVAIPVSDVVLFLGGVLRCRAPWFDGTNEGPCLSVFTGVQQQCATRGHCSAATPKSGASQQSVNGSAMAQARHTPATFSDAPSAHPAADSTWETVKAQVRHTPATNSISSMVHPAADAAWKTKKTKSGHLQASQQCVKETLKTLARHAHATNSDASTVHPVAVSAQRSAKDEVRLQASQWRKKGTVKTQAYNTPATKPDSSPVQPVDDSAWENSSGRRLRLEKLES